jgi:hypothetical protein
MYQLLFFAIAVLLVLSFARNTTHPNTWFIEKFKRLLQH